MRIVRFINPRRPVRSICEGTGTGQFRDKKGVKQELILFACPTPKSYSGQKIWVNCENVFNLSAE